MKLHCLSSSSLGNCYIFETKNDALVIEAGVHFSEVKKALDFNTSKVAGCLVSHSHGDHAKFLNEFLYAGLPVFSSEETLKEKGISNSYKAIPIKPNKSFSISSFQVKPFELKHDVKCFGYLVYHSEMGLSVFITDTHYVPFVFEGLNNIILEVNYSEEILNNNLESGKLPKVVRDRVLYSHISLETAKGFLMANDLTKVNNIVLTHLSDSNSNAIGFKYEIEKLTGKTVLIADKGSAFNLNKTPF